VLIGDLVGDDEDAVAQAASQVVRIANARGGEGFIAASPEARKRFWLERARTAAIAKHTNAFKVNEDVVIPLDRLGDYTNGVERLNIGYSIRNKLKLAAALEAYLEGDLPAQADGEAISSEDLLGDRPAQALELVRQVKARWSFVLDNLDRTLGEVRAGLETRGIAGVVTGQADERTVFSLVQLHELRVSWKRELRDPLRQVFAGRAFEPVMAGIQSTHAEVLRGRVFVALHMHAGDGNVHTNIPVNSDDYEMLHAANEAVAYIMRFAKELGGVVSGEHGIGITKMEFLEPAEIAAFAAWKARIDPEGRFNRGKLLAGADLSNAYTPSFALIGHESIILERSDIGSIADSVKDCLRCGKCKPVCATHVPRANLLYSPRNKILGLSLLTEAFLYEEQTRRGVSLRHFDEFGDVADHCTVCHKCESPCPVDIDFGNVSIAMRNLLAKLGKKRFNPGTAASMFYLNATDPTTIKIAKTLMLDWGYKAQRVAHAIARRFLVTRGQTRRPPATVGKPSLKAQAIHFINKPMPGDLPRRTARALLDIEDASVVPIIRDPAKVTEESDAVF
jgi:ferredoxin